MEELLNQEGPLDQFEISKLRDWLAVMETDCEDFGEAPDDTRRMNRIRARLRIELERAVS